MTILITGAAGFLGVNMVQLLRSVDSNIRLIGIDNLSRKGSERNLTLLKNANCEFIQANIANENVIAALPKVNYIIDCAANPSVLAGVNGSSTLGLIKDNLEGTFYLLEKCKNDNAGFVLISTSRVYNINALNKIPLTENNKRFTINTDLIQEWPEGLTIKGVTESFSTQSPVSLYGATKLSSEILALEYHYSFGFPVWINRCGVIAGAGQFGKIDQGIFSFWPYQYALDRPLSFIGYKGKGFQARDVVHPKDVFSLVYKQIFGSQSNSSKVINIGGGQANTWSLFELDAFCRKHFRKSEPVQSVAINRAYDIPLYVTDYSAAEKQWDWRPQYTIEEIMDEIIFFTKQNLDFVRSIS